MTAKRRVLKRPMTPRHEPPHPWAFLQAWRLTAGLTQDDVATTIGTTAATVSRWESGQARADMETYMLLAQLYHAGTPTALLWPPPERQQADQLEEAYSIMRGMAPEDVKAWLAMGRRLRRDSDPPKAAA